MNIDVRKFAPKQVETVNTDDAAKLSEAIKEFKSIDAQILATEAKLKELKSQQSYYSGHVIPEIMEKLNYSTMTMKDGSEIAVKKVYSAKIKADKKAEAIQWLRNNGLGDIVKNNISVAFGQGEENKAMAYATLAKESGYEPSQSEKVEPQTLRVTMEDWKNKGNDVPQDLFWTFEGNQTKLK
jgi:hypothetical protein